MLDCIGFSTHGYVCIDYIMINRCDYDIRIRNKLIKVNDKEEIISIHQRKYSRKIDSKTYRRFSSMFSIDKQSMNSYRAVFEISKNNTKDIKSVLLIEMVFDNTTCEYKIKKIEDLKEQTIH